MPALTTHVLDVSIGKPAANLKIELEEFKDGSWERIASGITDKDGRLKSLLSEEQKLNKTNYRITFNTNEYYLNHKKECFYPFVSIVFQIKDINQHYHVPLLISGFGYSTYRGS